MVKFEKMSEDDESDKYLEARDCIYSFLKLASLKIVQVFLFFLKSKFIKVT